MNRILVGDCRETMRSLIAEGAKVQCVVTSPPYWRQRDYGMAGQLGLEKTPEEYVTAMVEVFGLVRELLKDDGTLWLNLGDSYSGSGKGGNPEGSEWKGFIGNTAREAAATVPSGEKRVPAGLKPKDLCGIPWRVAFALQADGWYLRQDIIWSKPNPMPESVRDRCTKAHEYLFLLAKSESYYFDQDAIRQPLAQGVAERYAGGPMTITGQFKGSPTDKRFQDGKKINGADLPTTANKRSVWTVATRPYDEAHFATFPPALIEPCILAGSRPGDVVFDPFMGSGTTGEVAQRFGRQWLGCELNPEYAKLAETRTSGTMGMQFA